MTFLLLGASDALLVPLEVLDVLKHATVACYSSFSNVLDDFARLTFTDA